MKDLSSITDHDELRKVIWDRQQELTLKKKSGESIQEDLAILTPYVEKLWEETNLKQATPA